MKKRNNYQSIPEESINSHEPRQPLDVNRPFGEEGEKNMEDVMMKPTIPPSVTDPGVIVQKIKEVVNPRGGKIRLAQKIHYVGAKFIPKGKIGVCVDSNSGSVNVVPPGRWSCLDPFVKWRGVFDVESPVIKVENLTIVNIQNGYYGRCTNNSYPYILEPGRHVKLSAVFNYTDQVPINQTHIEHKTVHLINVPKGRLARITIDQLPKLLDTGLHAFTSSRFGFIDTVDAGADLIQHGTITMFRVNMGRVVVAWEDQQPMFFDKPKIYVKDSPNFKYVRDIDAKEKYYQLGARKNVTVYNGEVGISFKQGVLKILEPGFHQINDPTWIFDGFMITRQRTLDLTSRKRGDFLECETKDLVKVGLKATLFYKIADPTKTIIEIGEQKDIEPFLLDTAIACLNSIIRSTTLTEVARSIESPEQYKKGLSVDHENKVPSAPMFFDRAHDEFLFKLHDDFLKRYGLNIVDLRIESFKIIEEELSTQISRQAIQTAKTQTQLANLEGKREVATSDLNREAEVQAIKNKIYSDKIQMETTARTSASLKEAEIEAQKIIVVAKARAEAKKIQAQADFDYVKTMAQLPLGRETLLLKLKTEMVKESLGKTNKVVFLDSKNPLSFFQQMVDNVGNLGGIIKQNSEKKE